MALKVLLHNMDGPYAGFPRTVGWGYPEPYTRDLMISILGIGVTGNQSLLGSLKRVLETLAGNQTEHGHIPSLVHDPDDVGANAAPTLYFCWRWVFSESCQMILIFWQRITKSFAVDILLKVLWIVIGWRNEPHQRLPGGEQWVMGYGLYVNTLVFSCLKIFGYHNRQTVCSMK